jgi:hypothetical protein
LASKALAPSAVRIQPMLHSRHAAEETRKAPDTKPPVQHLSYSSDDEQGGLLIQGFWAHGTDIIIDICMTDMDAKLYHSWNPHKVLATQEQEMKRKCLQSCLEQHKRFTPFAVSTDGLIGGKEKRSSKDSCCDSPTNGRYHTLWCEDS